MPVYNREKLVPYAIESVLNQTYTDFEFLILDDGSTDGTFQVLQNYAKKDSRIKILKNETNKGIPFSRNKLQKEARGKYLTIMDSDDQMFKDLLEKSVQILENNSQITFVYTQRVYLYHSPEQSKIPMRQTSITHMLEENILSNVGNTIRKSFVDQNYIIYHSRFKVAEDYDYWTQVLLKGGKPYLIQEPLMAIRVHRFNGQDYYQTAEKNKTKIAVNFCHKTGIPKEICAQSLCQKLTFLKNNHISKNWFNSEELSQEQKEVCLIENKILSRDFIVFIHPLWTRRIIRLPHNRLFRDKAKEYATILKEENDFIRIKWDTGTEETYLRRFDNTYSLQQ